MKNISKILAFALGVATIASCDLNKTPVWSDDNAFAAFDKTAISVSETGGAVSIPITVASIDPIEVSVSFEVVDSLSSAKEGVNFSFGNAGGVVTFDGEARTAYVDVNVIDNPGVFTGDLSFTIKITSAGDLKIGANKTCTVTILDQDHPLSFILGTYSASADSYFSSRGHFDWNVEFVKDADDLNMVWIHNLEPYFAQYGYVASAGYNIFYGNVNEDKTAITVPQEQAVGYEGVVLMGFNDADADAATGYADINISIQDGGNTLVITNAWGAYEDGWWNLFNGPIKLTKK